MYPRRAEEAKRLQSSPKFQKNFKIFSVFCVFINDGKNPDSLEFEIRNPNFTVYPDFGF